MSGDSRPAQLGGMEITALRLAERFLGVKEFAGQKDHPLIVWWHSLCALGDAQHDEIPWCSSFANGVAWLLNLPRSKSAAARSWLAVGREIKDIRDAHPGFDVVVFSREGSPTAGHVAFFVGLENGYVRVLGGNQADAVTYALFHQSQVLGVRRLCEQPWHVA